MAGRPSQRSGMGLKAHPEVRNRSKFTPEGLGGFVRPS